MAGIYLHIPFCKKICHYCDFYRIISPDDIKPFISAIKKEAAERSGYLAGEEISTIYFGGGTPSVLSISELNEILSALYRNYSVKDDCEITAEINPDDPDEDWLKGLRKAGFNRISLGVQSWRDKDLKLLNRRHDSAQAEKTLKNIHKADFENVTIDLIYGLPGLSSAAWAENLDKSFSFDIQHISAYHLTIEPGTFFGKMKKAGRLQEADEEESNSQFNILIEKTEQAGFIHYEISNFGKEGYFSKHNSNYWKQVNYIGLGPSAHSFNNFSRQWNIKNVQKYIDAVNNGYSCFETEELNIKTRFNEYIMTSLRTMWGVDLEYVEKNFDKEGYDYIINMAGKFIGYGLMKHENKNLVLTNQGKLISDNIISEFMMVG
jgi:oxygen-independent coproporphyrinogen III oxidase